MKIFFLHPGYFYPAVVAMLLLLFFYWRKKFVLKDFSYLILVQKAFQRLNPWERWKNHLLLFVRLLILFLLAAIFARPFHYWGTPYKRGSGIDVVIAVDNSFSLGWTSSGQSNLERTKELVNKLKTLLPENTAIALLSFSDTINWYSEKFTYSGTELNQWLKEIKQKSEETNLAVAIRYAHKILQSRASPNKVILILTDGQKTFLEKENFLKDFNSAWELIGKEKVIVIEVNPEKLPNRSISNLRISAAGLTGQINNYGFSSGEPIFCTLHSPGKIIGRNFFLPKKEQESIEISFSRQELPDWGILEISGDNLTGDNFGYFVLPPAISDEVLIFDGDPQFGSVRSESFYLRQALTAINWRYRIATENDFSIDTLKRYSWIILANWRLSDFQATILKEFWNSGGNILIFAGDKINSDVYNQQDWLPMVIGDILPDRESIRPVFQPGSFLPWPDFDWDKISVLAQAVQAKKDSQQFLRLKSNRPLLVGKNNVYFLATAADRDWGNLAIKPVYTFILEKILNSSVRSDWEIPEMVNSQELHLLKNSVIILRDNQIRTFPANIRRLAIYRSAGWEELPLPGILKEPGIYRISGELNNQQINKMVAVNFPANFTESNLEKFRLTEFQQISRKKFHYLTEKQLPRVRQIILGKSAGTTFWLLLIIFLEIEFLLGIG